MLIWIRDWWRGYSDADYVSMLDKLANPKMREPGGMIAITQAELLAYHGMHRRMMKP